MSTPPPQLGAPPQEQMGSTPQTTSGPQTTTSDPRLQPEGESNGYRRPAHLARKYGAAPWTRIFGDGGVEVKQILSKRSLIEVLTACDLNNRYDLFTNDGRRYYLKEDTDCLCRNCLRQHRAWTVQMLDTQTRDENAKVLYVATKDQVTCHDLPPVCMLDCCRPKMQVTNVGAGHPKQQNRQINPLLLRMPRPYSFGCPGWRPSLCNERRRGASEAAGAADRSAAPAPSDAPDHSTGATSRSGLSQRTVMNVGAGHPKQQGWPIGQVQDPFNCCHVTERIVGEDGNDWYNISAHICSIGFWCPFCFGVDLPIRRAVGNGSSYQSGPEVGAFTKKAGGLTECCAGDLNTTIKIDLPGDCDTDDKKALLVMTGVLLDMTYFENNIKPKNK